MERQYVLIHQDGLAPCGVKVLHNGIDVAGVVAIDIRMRIDEITTAFVALLADSINLDGEVEGRFFVQGKEVEKILYKDGSIFPSAVSMEEMNRIAMLKAGISRIH